MTAKALKSKMRMLRKDIFTHYLQKTVTKLNNQWKPSYQTRMGCQFVLEVLKYVKDN